MLAKPAKKTRLMVAAWYVAVLPVVLASCSAAPAPKDPGACELRVAWDPYEPYSYAEGSGDPVGFDIEVVKRVAAEIQCSLTFREMPWNDILLALEDGRTDITVGTGFKPDRAEWSWYSESYRDEIVGLLMRKGTAAHFPGDALETLLAGGMKLGKTTDDTYDAVTETVFARYPSQILERVSEADNLERLLDGRIDTFLVEVNVAAALARRRDVAGRIEFHPLAFPAGTYRLQMSKKTVSPDRVATINAAIQRLVASGWTERTLQTYGID